MLAMRRQNERDRLVMRIEQEQERVSLNSLASLVHFVDDIPRTETGKIQKRLIREPYWAGYERKI